MSDGILIFPGSATLAETERACETGQRDKTSKLTGIKAAQTQKDGVNTKVNVPTFVPANILDILDDLKLVDVSTVGGAAAGAQAFHTHTFMFDCKIFVQGQLKDVKVFGKQSADE